MGDEEGKGEAEKALNIMTQQFTPAKFVTVANKYNQSCEVFKRCMARNGVV